MPELPEVETTRRGIEKHIAGQIITDVIIRNHRLRWPVPEDLAERCTGAIVHSVSRRAKYLLINLNSGTIIIHLGMSGSLRICSADTPVQKHDHIDFVFNHKILRLRDPRRFGAVLWTGGEAAQHKLLALLGPEPLDKSFDGHYLFRLSRKRSCSIKSLIMNSSIVAGVGNIYACESLFISGINPGRRAGSVSLQRCEALANAIKATLKKAIRSGGTTLQDFVREDGRPGYFAQKLLVYGRAGAPCSVCSHTIKKITRQNRSTFYCTSCQK